MTDLGSYRVQNVLPTIYYIPNFISEEEERHVLEKIPANRWVSLSHRRLQAIPTQLTANNTLLASPLPGWLVNPVVARFAQLGIFKDAPHGVNHCLINEYLSGQGIMPHEDGAAYHPVVATVSLGGSVVLDVVEKRGQVGTERSSVEDTRPAKHYRILQEPRSLLVTTQSAYSDTLHGIADLVDDVDLNASTVANWDLLGNAAVFEEAGGCNKRSTRISLTFRDVKKVSNLGRKIFGQSKT